jgi:choline dehydrogenase-like flavoprotein
MVEAGTPVVAVLLVALMLPRGCGRLSLKSPDPMTPPNIDLNYCSDPEDERRLVEGVRFAWRVLGTNDMAKVYQRISGLSDTMVASDGQLRSYISGKHRYIVSCLGYSADRTGRGRKRGARSAVPGAGNGEPSCRRRIHISTDTQCFTKSDGHDVGRTRRGLAERSSALNAGCGMSESGQRRR